MKKKLTVLLLVACGLLVFSACTNLKQATTTAPKIRSLKIGFDDRTNAKFEEIDATLFRNFIIELEEPARWKSITNVTIENKEFTWQFDKSELKDQWENDRNRFGLWSYYSDEFQHTALLGTYTITISENGKKDSVFEMKAFSENDPAKSTGRIFSDFSGSNPKIIAKPTKVAAKISGATLTVTVKGIDPNTNYAFFWLYDSSDKFIQGVDMGANADTGELSAAQRPNLTFTYDLKNKAATVKTIIIVLLREKPIFEERKMMYRYLHEITF